MEDKKFNIEIDAPPSKVWETLWSDKTYPQWTSPFCEGSHAITDWQEGSKVLFLDHNKDGGIAMIADKRPNEYMSLKMLGEVKNGVEDYESEAACGMVGGFENYTLTEANGKTHLEIHMGGTELPQDIMDYMYNAWPKALRELKRLAEQN